jgi:hypothetical protein
MALFGSSWIPKVVVGVGVALVAPVIVPTFAAGLRFLVKAAIKGGLIMYDKSQEIAAEAGEQMSDLVAEARAELKASAPTTHAHSAATPPHANHVVEAAE